MKAFIEAQFSYCSIIWMFHSRTLNNRINNLHERALRIVYNDHTSTFSELLERDNSFSIHHRNLQKLATEMYKLKNNLSPAFMQTLFKSRDITYNLRTHREFQSEKIRTSIYGSETISYRGPKTWDLVPDDIKESANLNIFKNKIKFWSPVSCTCKMFKIYIPELGSL